ncbi:PP2C family protein-serine/threonine phosphatase [Occallatibacter savannae]|uniref:PP2C family protein-serine/threonine phosphatase n=1 Tax=Occallatibacter savannae TaxID=1002691 RepID=UPI000D690278|nr:PP2C family protein-serine/threonine phosphatase [Occallatibacter savannae]
MRKLPLLILLIPLCLYLRLSAQEPAPNSDDPNLIDRPHAQDWITDVDPAWLVREGNDPAWSSSSFDDSQWETVRLDDLGAAESGERWFRRHLKLHDNHPELRLLIQGGIGTYTLYLNGNQLPGPEILSSLQVNRPAERVFTIQEGPTDVVIALRTRIPTGYAAWRFPQFMSVNIGTPDAIETERQSMYHDRTSYAIPALVINALIAFAGLALFALYSRQRGHTEYFWLGLYFLLVGTIDVIYYLQHSGFVPLVWNVGLADPVIYAAIITQTRFTFAFGGHRLGRLWNIFQNLLIIPAAFPWLVWFGSVKSQTYMIIEPLIILPVAILLPILLFIWYRRGNREAGWLVLPSLLPPITLALYDLGSASIYFGLSRFEFLVNTINIGPVELEPNDLGNLLFLLSSLIVIFFRFSRVAHDQARSAADFAAAREIQQQLIPASLPTLPGLHIEAAYIPAEEVAGDFYQVIEQPGGSALIVIGDVSGKGLKAAMTGTLAIGALRTLAVENLAPAELLRRLNRQICEAKNGGFITCCCARIDSEGAITLANAGHLSPYSGGVEIEVPSGLPLGLVPNVDYEESHFNLAPSRTLTLVSDGIVEASDSSGQLYGFERTRAISTQSAAAIAAAAKAFGQEDDITVLTVARVTVPIPA